MIASGTTEHMPFAGHRTCAQWVHGINIRDRAIIELYKLGLTFTDIGPRFGLSPSSVGNVLRRHHVARRPRGTRSVLWHGAA